MLGLLSRGRILVGHRLKNSHTLSIVPGCSLIVGGTRRLHSVKYLFEEANIV